MIEIKASTKVTGKRRWASVQAAKRKVRDGSLYLIRRHGGYFRPEAQGYTIDLAAAGIFDAQTARGYLDVEDLSVVPVKSVIPQIKADIIKAQRTAQMLRDMLAMFGATP